MQMVPIVTADLGPKVVGRPPTPAAPGAPYAGGAGREGRRATASTPTTIAHPTANTVQRVIEGVTHTLPMIGEAAINKAKRNSAGAFRMAGRIARKAYL
jgi:hypothetical protein